MEAGPGKVPRGACRAGTPRMCDLGVKHPPLHLPSVLSARFAPAAHRFAENAQGSSVGRPRRGRGHIWEGANQTPAPLLMCLWIRAALISSHWVPGTGSEGRME